MIKLKRLTAMLMIICMFASMCIVSAQTAAPIFADVETGTHEEALKLLAELGVIKGVGLNAEGIMDYAPDREVTRQEMAMFLARIRSATPEYFVPDESLKTIFDDVHNPIFFSAINYCVEMDIINGMPDGTFKPLQTVTLQEAVKMMVTALGYTGLSFPVGYLAKANEPEVNLLEGFRGVSATKTLTRLEVANLLYNFFLSSYNYLDVTYNSIDQKYESRLVTKPVCETFGISKTTAYITGVVGYSADITVRDDRITAGTVTLTGSPLTEKEAAAAARADVQLSYYTTSTSGSTTTANVTQVKTATDNLGITADTTDLRKLLGLKVTMYRSLKGANATVPSAHIAGSKTEVEETSMRAQSSDTSAEITGDNYDTVKSVTINGKVYDMTPPADLSTVYNLYSYGNTDKLSTRTVTADTLLQMARFIDQKGYYKLEYVDNGTDPNGDPEFYYIFTPYHVGFYEGVDSDGNIKLSGAANGKNDAELIKNLKVSGETVTLTQNEAYLYTIHGLHLDVYKRLTKVSTDTSPSLVYETTAVFPNLTAEFGKATAYKAIGSFATAAGKFAAGNAYTLFASEAGERPFFAFATTTTEVATMKDYGVITGGGTSSGVINGKAAFLYTMVPTGSSSPQTIMVSRVNGSDAAANTLTAGNEIAYRRSGDTYEAFTASNTGFVLSGQGRVIETGSPLASSSNLTYSATSGILTTVNTPLTSIVTANTKFMFINSTGASARAMSRDEFNTLITTTPIPATRLVVASSSAAAASEALAIFVTSNLSSLPGAPTLGNYAMVISTNEGVSTTGYYFATAYSYRLGTDIKIASADAGDLAVGNILNVSADTMTFEGLTGTFYRVNSLQNSDLSGYSADLPKLLALSVPTQSLTSYQNHAVLVYNASVPATQVLNDKDINVITVTLYTALTTSPAATTGNRGGTLTAPNWTLGTNARITSARRNQATITSNPVIYTDTNGASEHIYKYYIHSVDVGSKGVSDFVTLIEYVIDDTTTTFPS